MISKSEFSDSVLSSSSPVCDSRGGISGSSSESVRSCFLCIELTVVGSRVGHLEQDLVNQWPKLELWCICSRHREKIFLFYAGDNQMDRITSELSALPIYWKDISEVRSNCLRKPRRAEKNGKISAEKIQIFKKYKFSKRGGEVGGRICDAERENLYHRPYDGIYSFHAVPRVCFDTESQTPPKCTK